MTLDIAKLKAAAERASGGEWVKEAGDGWEAVCSADDQVNGGFIIAEFHGPGDKENREFVQAANPSAVLELIASLEAAEKHIAELEAAPVASVAEGETAVMPDYPGTALTQRECYQLGLEAGKAETQTASQWRPANKCVVCVEGARGGCSTCAFNRQ
ncbi:ead/Ea22-like family protein [Franconibacter helveticus]|uniref:ead/Ea22-like family protein n=1 Tax=Franconibacter helveticus TaxID=357240 RepID=UPI00066A146D|nr:ead/Ea22-like family protein [Franconibacter helveticus]